MYTISLGIECLHISVLSNGGGSGPVALDRAEGHAEIRDESEDGREAIVQGDHTGVSDNLCSFLSQRNIYTMLCYRRGEEACDKRSVRFSRYFNNLCLNSENKMLTEMICIKRRWRKGRD